MRMIGVFDSGFGGLTVFKEIRKALPQYNYLYLGDNLRAPYGGRSQEMIYQFTRQAVDFLFSQGCELVILACNTASAEALRKLQQEWLPARNVLAHYDLQSPASEAGGPKHYPAGRILGVIRPLAEAAAKVSRFGRVGVVGTRATVESRAYERELKAQNSKLKVFQNAAPLLVPLIEEGWLNKPETRMIVKKYLRPLKDAQIDTLILGCTHYPLLMKQFVGLGGKRIKVLNAPKIVAEKLIDYLKRHPEIEQKLIKQKTPFRQGSGGQAVRYLTTGDPKIFSKLGGGFLGSKIQAEKIAL